LFCVLFEDQPLYSFLVVVQIYEHVYLCRIVDNVRGEINKRQWIVFDGDVDPEWVENLNSVLDDNKLLTLPNGERLAIPPNVRIMFEVQDLRFATLATVSRCGMVWFSEDVLSTDMIFDNYLQRLRNVPIEETEEEVTLRTRASKTVVKDEDITPILQVMRILQVALECFVTSQTQY
jgi:dynein heavy chain 1